jgi:hypothetical protein
MVLQDINLSSDRNGATVIVVWWYRLGFLSSVCYIYLVSSVYFNCTLISYVRTLQCLISVRKLHALPLFCVIH